MAAFNYSANKYLNSKGGDASKDPLRSALQNSLNRTQNQEETGQKNWELHQLRMNQSLNQLVDAFSKTSNKSAFSSLLDSKASNRDEKGDDDDDEDFENRPSSYRPSASRAGTELNENSSTMEFKKYLDDLKRSYLSKLTLSCPSKMPNSALLASANNSDKLTQTGVKNSPMLPASQQFNARRSLYFDSLSEQADDSAVKLTKSEKKASSAYSRLRPVALESQSLKAKTEDEEVEADKEVTSAQDANQPELSRTQLTSRLVQVREYLKQAYTMLSSLHLSNDSMNQSAQMDKLHSMIDQLKDQEKGYMDLLNSFSKYQQFTETIQVQNKRTASGEKANRSKDLLDLSEINDQSMAQDEALCYSSKSESKKGLKAANTPANSLAESFNAGCLYNLNRFSQLDDSIRSNCKRLKKSQEPEENNDSSLHSITGSFISDTITLNVPNGEEGGVKYFPKKLDLNTHAKNLNDLMVIGQSCFKVIKDKTRDDEEEDKTENDQDALEGELTDGFEFDSDFKVDRDKKTENDHDAYVTERNEVIAAIANDLAELSELQDQKNLLKSIRLHKEELKALNGRRKALEALQKVALESEMKLDEAFDVLDKDKSKQKSPTPSPARNSEEYQRNKQQLSSELNSFNQYLSMLNEKQSERSRLHDVSINEGDNVVTRTSKPGSNEKAPMIRKTFKHTDAKADSDLNDEPSSQIEKSKTTLKKFEELLGMSKLENDKNLLKPISPARAQPASDHQGLLEQHLAELAVREKKLEELYSMQAKLSKLSEIVNKFNDIKTELAPESGVVDDQEDLNPRGFSSILAEEPKPMWSPSSAGKEVVLSRSMPSEKASGLKTPGQSIKELMDVYSNSDNEEQLAKEQLEEHKIKLENAKQKLRQLQDLIQKLQAYSSPESEEKSLTPRQQHELQQKEAAAAMELLNQIEKEKREEKIEELKRNKEKLLKLLKDKENESTMLSNMYASRLDGILKENQRLEASKKGDTLFEETKSAHEKANADLEANFKTADSNFESIIANDKSFTPYQTETLDSLPDYSESPSDLLWIKMKQQLDMRENMRNNKKELEDMIKYDESEMRRQMNKSHEAEDADDSDAESKAESKTSESPIKDNEIINGYKEFFMRAKAANTLKISLNDNKDDEDDDASETAESVESEKMDNEEESNDDGEFLGNARDLFKSEAAKKASLLRETSTSPLNNHTDSAWYSNLLSSLKDRKKQENICTTAELIKEDSDTDNIRATHKAASTATTFDHQPHAQLLSSLEKKLSAHDEQFNQLFLNQHKMNDLIQKSFTELLKNQQQQQQQSPHAFVPSSLSGSSSQADFNYTMNSQFQFQTHMQVQQLVFNLNAAYTELASQRGEISKLQEQVKKLSESSSQNSTIVKENCDKQGKEAKDADDSDLYRRPSSITTMNALPSYFYSRRSNDLIRKEKGKFSEEELTDDNAFDSNAEDNRSFSIRINKTANSINSLYNKARAQLASKQQASSHCNQNKHEVYYTDDFEDLDDEEDKSSKPITNAKCSAKFGSELKRKASTSSSVSVSSSTTIASHVSSNLADRKADYLNQQYKSLPASASQFKDTYKKPAAYSQTNETQSKEGYNTSATFDRMREKIYSEVATLISQNESRPFYLLNLFRELQFLKDKNGRDQILKSIFNISNHIETSTQASEGSTLDLHANSKPISRSPQQTKVLSKPESKLNCFKLPVNTSAFLNAGVKQTNNYDDDDDVITYKYRMLKSGANSNRKAVQANEIAGTTATESNLDDDDANSQTTPFESDSLSNTIIFVKNSPLKSSLNHQQASTYLPSKHETRVKSELNESKGSAKLKRHSNSSSSSIMSIKDDENRCAAGKYKSKDECQSSVVGEEVKGFISKIITMIKVSDCEENGDDLESRTESESNDTESESIYKNARCDSDYLNEIIDKVLSVLKQSNKHGDYLRLYQNQLSSRLKDALQKYQNKKLVSCLEDILIDISSILQKELSSYSPSSYQPKPAFVSMYSKESIETIDSSVCTGDDSKFAKTSRLGEKSNLGKSSPRKSPRLNVVRSQLDDASDSDFNQRTAAENACSKLFSALVKDHKRRVRNRDSSTSSSSSSSSSASSRSPAGGANMTSASRLASNTFYFDEQGCQAKLKDFITQSNECQASSTSFNKRYVDHSDILKRLKYILDEKAEKREEYDDLVENFDNIETISVSKKSSSSSSESSRSSSRARGSGLKEHKHIKPTAADIARIKTYSILLNEEQVKETPVTHEIADHFAEPDQPCEKREQEVETETKKEEEASGNQEEELKVQDEIAITNELSSLLDAEIDKEIMDCISENLAGDGDELPAELQARVTDLPDDVTQEMPVGDSSQPSGAAPVEKTEDEDGAELLSKKSSSSTSDHYVMISSNCSNHDDGGNDDAASDDSRQDADCSLKADDDCSSKLEENNEQTVIVVPEAANEEA